MSKIADIIKYEGDNSTFIWKHPCEDFNSLTQLIVHESQEAIFFMNGEALDLFGAGRHTLETQNIPKLGKGILAISQNEEPFDVFICYKETDNGGRRTPDSVLAQELYYQLIGEGFKVFFARITLEDKLGSAYEPYIFAALNSAKVMVVLGTKPEHFNAVWVKNEWSRYLSLIKNGAKKTLIPAYRDMDPYDLPEEFSHLQAQDMSKLGFMQDLIHGINKIATKDEPKATIIKETITTPTTANTAPLLERAFMFLEDGDWQSADEYCEKVLDQDPKNAQAYLGKLMAELKVKKQDSLKNCAEPFDHSNNYQKAIRFADEKLRTALIGYIEDINTRNENARLEGIYSKAIVAMNSANATQDKVFLLSTTEANKYFRSARARQCKATDYAVAHGVYVYNGNCGWWLRSPGYNQFNADVVSYGGNAIDGTYGVNNDERAVRPALWIDLD